MNTLKMSRKMLAAICGALTYWGLRASRWKSNAVKNPNTPSISTQ
jgi:hypothetical protein